MRKQILIAALFVCSGLAAFAQKVSKLDTIVRHAARSLINDRRWMSCSAAIVKHGKTYIYHSGSANGQTLYEIGSTSKSFSSLIFATPS